MHIDIDVQHICINGPISFHASNHQMNKYAIKSKILINKNKGNITYKTSEWKIEIKVIANSIIDHK